TRVVGSSWRIRWVRLRTSPLRPQQQWASISRSPIMAKVAWKRLNATDYKNINGQFAGAGGGGATYIVLGKSLPAQDFASFFPALVNDRIAVKSAEGTF